MLNQWVDGMQGFSNGALGDPYRNNKAQLPRLSKPFAGVGVMNHVAGVAGVAECRKIGLMVKKDVALR